MKQFVIVADENIPGLSSLLADIAEIRYLPGRDMKNADLRDADALFVRSVTQVNESLLANTSVRYVGTCTIGVDHVDVDYLQQQGIAFASAPGCNAAAVVDYVLAAMFAVFKEPAVLLNKTVGIVGCGQVGSRLKARLANLGISALICDPYKPDNNATMEEILQCDVISLHVPLVKTGAHPTWHLLNADALDKIHNDALLINTSRGEVVDNQHLLQQLSNKRFHCVLDVYEHEPRPSMELLQALTIATAHIAGYSMQGKIRGTVQVVESFFQAFNIRQDMPDLLAPLHKNLDAVNHEQNALQLIKAAYDIIEDSKAFIALMQHAEGDVAKVFDAYRKNYPVRYEWSFLSLAVSPALNDLVRRLGFQVL